MLQGFNIEICQVKKELITLWLMHCSLQGSECQTFLEGKKCLILIVTLSCVLVPCSELQVVAEDWMGD